MTGDDAETDWYGAVANAYATIEHCREQNESSNEDAERDQEADQTLVGAGLQLCALRRKRPSRQPNPAELEAAKRQTGAPQAVFLAMFGDDPSGKWDVAQRNLKIAQHQLAAVEQPAVDPSVGDELRNIDVGPAIFRICCEMVADAVFGVPLPGLLDIVFADDLNPGRLPDSLIDPPLPPEPPDPKPPSGPKGPGGL